MKPRYSKDIYQVVDNDFNLSKLKNIRTGQVEDKSWSRHKLQRIDNQIDNKVKKEIINQIKPKIKTEKKIKKEVINLIEDEIQDIINDVRNKKQKKQNINRQNKRDIDDIINDIQVKKKLKQKNKKIQFSRTKDLPKQSYKTINGKRQSTRQRKKPKRYGYDDFL